MTIINKDTLFGLFEQIDQVEDTNIFTATIEITTQNNFWGTRLKLHITQSKIGKGVLVTLFRDGHVTIKPQSTFSKAENNTQMLVLQEQPLGSRKVAPDGSHVIIETHADMSVAQLIDLIVEHYPALKKLNQLTSVDTTNLPNEQGIT